LCAALGCAASKMTAQNAFSVCAHYAPSMLPSLRKRGSPASPASSSRSRAYSENVYSDTINAAAPPPGPPGPPGPPDSTTDTPTPPSPSQRIVKKLKGGGSKIKAAIKQSTQQRRFWFIMGGFLGFFIPTLLFAPKILHTVGVTETDLMDDFITGTMMPFINDKMSTRYLDNSARPGTTLAGQGAAKKHPVFLVPGFVTTGLELWEGEPCAQKYFRQRMWGSTTMVQNFLQDRDCWLRHLKLDPLTGLDPQDPEIRLRAAQGFEAADYLISNYWVWAHLITNLADVGYDSSTMHMFAYDWRLAPKQLEQR